MNEAKQKKLEQELIDLDKVAIAYSGGIDSSFLLWVANKVLPREKVIAILANGDMVPRKDYQEAIEFLTKYNFQYIEIPYEPLKIEAFRENRKDRCYYCKKALMTNIQNIAREKGFSTLLDGKNADDLKEYRPGNKATTELGVISPLAENAFDKTEIRKHSREFGISCWNKPSNSCLATRFPYDTQLTKQDLDRVGKAEELIKQLGINNVRVRVHKEIARIEVQRENFDILLNRKDIIQQIQELGFKYITLDLLGLKRGSFDQ